MAAAEGATAGRALTPAHRRFLVRDALLIAAVANGVLNALIAWLFTLQRGRDPAGEGAARRRPVGARRHGRDVLRAAVPDHPRDHDRDRVEGDARRSPHAGCRASPGSFADRLPKTRLRRATWIGLICLVLFGPLSAAGVLLFDYGDISVGEFVHLQGDLRHRARRGRDALDRDGRVRRRPAARRQTASQKQRRTAS